MHNKILFFGMLLLQVLVRPWRPGWMCSWFCCCRWLQCQCWPSGGASLHLPPPPAAPAAATASGTTGTAVSSCMTLSLFILYPGPRVTFRTHWRNGLRLLVAVVLLLLPFFMSLLWVGNLHSRFLQVLVSLSSTTLSCPVKKQTKKRAQSDSVWHWWFVWPLQPVWLSQ